jgi:hypothetical protein
MPLDASDHVLMLVSFSNMCETLFLCDDLFFPLGPRPEYSFYDEFIESTFVSDNLPIPETPCETSEERAIEAEKKKPEIIDLVSDEEDEPEYETIEVFSEDLKYLAESGVSLVPGCIVCARRLGHCNVKVPNKINAYPISGRATYMWPAVMTFLINLNSISREAVVASIDLKGLFWHDGQVVVHPQAIEFSSDPDVRSSLHLIPKMFNKGTVERQQIEGAQAKRMEDIMHIADHKKRTKELGEFLGRELEEVYSPKKRRI